MQPEDIIDLETAKNAAKLAQAYADRLETLCSSMHVPQAKKTEEIPEDISSKVLRVSDRKRGWIKASDVQRAYSKKPLSAEQIRGCFKGLEAKQKGITRGEGNRMEFTSSVAKIAKPDTSPPSLADEPVEPPSKTIKDVLDSKEVSFLELAVHLGVNETLVRQWARGQAIPILNVIKMHSLLEFLGITFDEFFEVVCETVRQRKERY
jgi:ribosome-binding protein aMBF1 (putative translation factor)